MANTYNQLFIHLVYGVKHREGVIFPSFRQQLYEYTIAIIEKRGHRVYAIGGMQDHVHILVSMSPTQSVSDLVMEVKRGTSLWINQNRFVVGRFEWQEGYGAFSYGKSQVDKVVNYIRNQEEHHRKKTFREEYIEFLKLFEVEYDERYVFKDLT